MTMGSATAVNSKSLFSSIAIQLEKRERDDIKMAKRWRREVAERLVERSYKPKRVLCIRVQKVPSLEAFFYLFLYVLDILTMYYSLYQNDKLARIIANH